MRRIPPVTIGKLEKCVTDEGLTYVFWVFWLFYVFFLTNIDKNNIPNSGYYGFMEDNS